MQPHLGRLRNTPGWVISIAILAAGLVVLVPIVLLTIAAVLMGLIVMTLLTLVVAVVRTIGGLWRRIVGGNNANPPVWFDDGRRNVQVRRVKQL